MQVIHRKVVQETADDWQDFFFCSDIHYGESSCEISAFIKDLKEARKRNARICIIGDLLGMILPKDAKRFSPSVTKNSVQPFDAVVNKTVNELVDILYPYADLIDMIAVGNHEISVIKYHSVDVNALLLSLLASKCRESGVAFDCAHGGITGFLRYQFDSGGHRKPFIVHYHHGAGGAAPMSKGMIGMQRTKIQWMADLYVSGHDHNHWADADSMICLNSVGTIEVKNRRALKCGNYRIGYPKQDQETAANIDYTELFQAQVKPIGGTFVKVRMVKVKGLGTFFEQRVEI